MFKFAKIIHLDNDKTDYIFKPDKKQEFKTFSLTLWNDPQKTKPISSFNLNRFNEEKEKSKSIEDFNINKFNTPKTAEPKYEKFTSSKDVKPYNAEKGRYSNINTEDLLFNANVKDQIANQLDPKIEKLKQEIIARINLDDPNQEEHINLLLENNRNKVIKKTRTAKSIIQQKMANAIKEEQEEQLNQAKEEQQKSKIKKPILEIKPLKNATRRKITNDIKKQNIDIYNDLNDKQKYQLDKDLDTFFKPINEAKIKSEKRQVFREKIRRQAKERAEEKLRSVVRTRQQKKNLEKAFAKFQARFKGQQLRLGKNEEGRQYLQDKQERKQNATKIQAVYRGKLARDKAQKIREDIFNKEIENQATQKVRNKKLGIVQPEIVEAEPIQAEPLALGEMSENLNKLQNNASVFLVKFLRGEYTENTFNQKIKLNTLREICKLSNIDYNGKTKPQMIKLIKERLST